MNIKLVPVSWSIRRQPNTYSLVEIFLVYIKYWLQLKTVMLHPLTTWATNQIRTAIYYSITKKTLFSWIFYIFSISFWRLEKLFCATIVLSRDVVILFLCKNWCYPTLPFNYYESLFSYLQISFNATPNALTPPITY